MPYNSSTGQYSPVSGAETATAGQTIASATWNAINTDYSTALTQLGQGSFAPPSTSLALVNGLNSNITIPTTARAHITGPSGAFSVGGFTGGADGRRLFLFNATTQQMTIVNEDASSTAANRITTLSPFATNIVLQPGVSFATLSYDGTNSRWIVESVGSWNNLTTIPNNAVGAASTTVGPYDIGLNGVNFAAAASDVATFNIPLPAGAVGYQVVQMRIGNAQATLNGATVSLFTGAGATGTAVITSTATTVTTSLPNTSNSMQVMVPASTNTVLWNATQLFLHITTSTATSSLADVTLEIKPLF